jgi:ribosomal protein S12 methylthiotransferase
MIKTTVTFVTLGCPKNQVDSECIASSLDETQFNVVHGEGNADVVAINTCGFILDAKEQSVDTILEYAQARKEGSIKKLIVFGCLIERYGKELSSEIDGVDLWFGVNDSQKILQHIQASAEILSVRKNASLTTPSHYAYIKISEGCDRKCAFCAIPDIRGKHISRPIEEIIAEAKSLVSGGVKELIVIAQDTTYYGVDLYGKQQLPMLLEKLAIESGAKWIRLHYAYPSGFPLEVCDVIARYDNICKYIDIPFQHVNDEILLQMKRFHTKKDIEELIGLFRTKIPNVHIRTAFIAGFPGEDRAEFNELVAFLKKHTLERVGFFPYSHEEGTPAEKLGDTVSTRVKLKRADTLFQVQEKISMELNLAKVGSIEEIIIDEVYDTFLLGRTQFDSPEIDNLVTVHVKKGSGYKTGDFLQVKVTGADAWDLIAEPLKK